MSWLLLLDICGIQKCGDRICDNRDNYHEIRKKAKKLQSYEKRKTEVVKVSKIHLVVPVFVTAARSAARSAVGTPHDQLIERRPRCYGTMKQ